MPAVEPQKSRIDERGDRGVALRFRDQRFFTERIARLQLREHHLGATDGAADLKAARFDDVVVIAFVALADDDLAARARAALETAEKLVDARRRQRREYGAQVR